ncbi:POC1 centriolar protein A [Ceratobasidium sp. 428]|nr:POC1 centriolar protein A [Ceratobasidium sp. 428]
MKKRYGGAAVLYSVLIDVLQATDTYLRALDEVQSREKQSSVVEKAGRLGDAFKKLVDLGTIAAELDPTGGAKVAFAICTVAWKHLEEQEKQDEDLNTLVRKIERMVPSVNLVKGIADDHLKKTVTDMLHLIEDVSLFILDYRSGSSIGRALSAVVRSGVQEQAQEFITQFSDLKEEFDRRKSDQILLTTKNQELNVKLEKLEPVDKAGYNPDAQCLHGTPVNLIDELTAWALASSSGPFFAWLHGPAGFGKSSIAASVCHRLDGQHALSSSVFCKRDSPALHNPSRVLATIVYDLALRWKSYKDLVVEVVDEDPQLHLRHLQRMCDMLVRQPLQRGALKQQPGGNLVIVVDALDECGDTNTRRQLLACLRSLSQLGPWLKLVVTSRPDPDIQQFFKQGRADWFTEYDVLQYDASGDIQLFVKERFDNMAGEKWIQDEVDQISERAGGVFVWARTACEFIKSGYDKRDRFNRVLANSPLADIDALYTTAIKASVPDLAEDNIRYLRQCLGAVVVTATRIPLSTANLALLLHGRVSQSTLKGVVEGLASVLHIDKTNDEAVRIFHPSFMDYITDQARSKDLWIDLAEQNTVVAECCLRLLTEGGLKFNMCDLETSDQFNSDVLDLDARVYKVFRPHLSYSCLYWSSHISGARVESLESSIRRFLLGRKMLYWIEALSLLGKLSTALASLQELMACCAPGKLQDCRTAANDAYRFVLSFYDAISTSTHHLYLSALAFAPGDSGIAQRMRRLFPKLLHVTEENQGWSSCLRTISGTSRFLSVAFSSDSHRIVSGCWDGTLHIWDTETGNAALEPLTGHSELVTSVAFSPDGRWIVSGSFDKTIRVWDAETGEARLGPIHGHLDRVHSIAFSPDSRRIISGSDDKTVRVWSTETGEAVLHPLEGHLEAVMSVAFSPDGRRIVSGSLDKTLRVWDAETGEPVLQPLSGHSSAVLSVSFSSDGRWIVSGSWDRTVRMWDAKTGNVLLQPLTDHSENVESVVFSPDCNRIVLGSWDTKILVFDSHTGSLVQTLSDHSGPVTSVAFSSDRRRLASGSYDMTVRIWDVVDDHKAETTGQVQTHSGHTQLVYCVAYSPNGRYIASGSNDTTVRIWDAETGDAVFKEFEGHTNGIRSLAISPDSRRVVSGSEDNTVRVWDAETGKAAFDPLQGHTDTVTCVVFSHDGRLIASGSVDQTIWIWDAKTGQQALGPLIGHSDDLSAVVFSLDSQRVLSYSSSERVHIWDVKTGTARITPLEGYLKADHGKADHGEAAFSTDGRRIVLVSYSSIDIWDTETGDLILHAASQGHKYAPDLVVFSPDGHWIASASFWEQEVCIWSVETGEPVLESLLGHTDALTSVAFSPDNRRLVSGSFDATVRIWDVQRHTMSSVHTPKYITGTDIRILPSHEGDERVLVHNAQLARNTDRDRLGWVTSIEGKPLIWLPPERRDVDDSLICVPPMKASRRGVIDFTNFVHGESWRSIVDE